MSIHPFGALLLARLRREFGAQWRREDEHARVLADLRRIVGQSERITFARLADDPELAELIGQAIGRPRLWVMKASATNGFMRLPRREAPTRRRKDIE